MNPWDLAFTSLQTVVADAPANAQGKKEWREASALVRTRLSAPPGPEEQDDAVRQVEALRDLLLLLLERLAVEEKEAARERERRIAEDKVLHAVLQRAVARYGWCVVLSAILIPVFGVPFGYLVALAPVPGAFGFAGVHRVADAGEGRAWVVLRQDWDEQKDRARIYHLLAGVVLLVTLGRILFLAVGGGA